MELLKGIYHFFLAWLGAARYGFPSRKLFVIGVTGTKGKSTTIELISSILEAVGKKTALVSSVRFKIGDDSEKNTTSMSMPGRFFIQRFLSRAVRAKCDYAILEVTSQGILQYRHRFIDFDAALCTNLAPEHIEAHGSFENYRRAKVSFFESVARRSRKKNRWFFLNSEDSSREYFAERVRGRGAIVPFSRTQFVEEILNRKPKALGDWLSSSFNLENAAASSAFAASQKISWPVIEEALKNFKGVPGRLEFVVQKPFAVVVDYAHTPNALEAVYRTLRERGEVLITEKKGKRGRLICVLGSCGGGRDKWKRPVMGKIAGEYCDAIILTSEDPYDERPEAIIEEIAGGVAEIEGGPAKIRKIVDRRSAIQESIELAKSGDTVVITGKGSEVWLHIERGRKIPWNERLIVEETLAGRK